MNRRKWLWILLMPIGCRRDSNGAARALPPEVEGGWKLTRNEPFSPDEAPERIRKMGVKSGVRAAYKARDTITVSLYEMNAPASAFELQQKWRPESTKVPFFHGSFFGLAESPEAERDTLLSFIKSFEKALK